MEQFSTRMYIKVRNSGDFKKLLNIDLSKYGLTESASDLFDIADTEYMMEGSLMLSNTDLEDLIGEIVEILPEDCVIFSDTLCMTGETLDYFVCYFGQDIINDYVDLNSIDTELDLTDHYTWIDFLDECGIDVSDIERNYLKEFDF